MLRSLFGVPKAVAVGLFLYGLRLRRKALLLRAIWKRLEMRVVQRRTDVIQKGDILCFATVRNETVRLPYWLEHHRALGVNHFLIVDNASDDGTAEYLAQQSDVSLWHTTASYKKSRFGMDWLASLMWAYGSGHWCLTLDADELFVGPYHGQRGLPELTSWLNDHGLRSLGALMLDMYPNGPVKEQVYEAGADPAQALPFFDSQNYTIIIQKALKNLWIQGGPRARMFFSQDPRKAPTLSKVPLIKWKRSYVYVNSMHRALPRHLNVTYDTAKTERPSAVLLHTKFLNVIVEKSAEEKERGEHFSNSSLYEDYYDSLINNPVLHCAASRRYEGWRQLEALGLMTRGGWL